MKEPGPDHPITIEPAGRPVRIVFDGETVLETKRALLLREASYPPVLYVPRTDADMRYFTLSTKKTHCPYKGEASYFSLETSRRSAADAVWSYENPFPAVREIREHLAFYPQHVVIDYGG